MIINRTEKWCTYGTYIGLLLKTFNILKLTKLCWSKCACCALQITHRRIPINDFGYGHAQRRLRSKNEGPKRKFWSAKVLTQEFINQRPRSNKFWQVKASFLAKVDVVYALLFCTKCYEFRSKNTKHPLKHFDYD